LNIPPITPEVLPGMKLGNGAISGIGPLVGVLSNRA